MSDLRCALLSSFVFAVLVTIIFWMIVPAQYYDLGSTDFTARDLPMAQAIVAGQPFLDANNVVAIGFPFILVGMLALAQALGVSLTVVLQGLALVEMGVTAALVLLLARLIWSPRLAFLAACLWSTYPFALWLTKQTSTELSFLVVFFAALYFWWRGLAASNHEILFLALAGCLIGAAMLIRPFAFGFPVLMLFGIVLKRASLQNRLLGMIVLCASCFLVILPWEIFVRAETGRWVLLNDNGVKSLRDGLTFAVESKAYRVSLDLPEDVKSLMLNARTRQSALDSNAGIARFLWENLRQQPLTVLRFLVIKAARAWYATDSQRFESLSVLLQIFYLFPGILGAVMAWQYRRSARLLILMAASSVVYFWLITVAALPILRYMIPAMGLVILFIPGVMYAVDGVRQSFSKVKGGLRRA